MKFVSTIYATSPERNVKITVEVVGPARFESQDFKHRSRCIVDEIVKGAVLPRFNACNIRTK